MKLALAGIFWSVLALALIPATLAQAQRDWTIVGGNLTSTHAALAAFDEAGVSVTTSGGIQQVIPWRDIQELDRDNSSPAGTPAEFDLFLNGGDVIHGSPTALANDRLTWHNGVVGDVDLPEDRVNAFVRAGQQVAGLDQARTTDSVSLSNGDATAGIVEKIAGGGVSIRTASSDSATDLPLAKVSALLLADPDPSSAGAHGFRIWLTDGSSLSVAKIQLHGQLLNMQLSAASAKEVPLASVVSIEQVDGPVKWLTSLPIQQKVYKPYFNEQFPPRIDHPPGNTGMTIRQKYPAFHHGIGVHSYTKLTYAIPEGYSTFRTQYAIDRIDETEMSKADVTVRILLDDQVTSETPHVRFGKVSEPKEIALGTAKTLALEVNYGDNLAAQGRLVWLDPAFLKTGSATAP